MIEHRLYEIELYEKGELLERQILIMTPHDATIYRLKGYSVYDYTASLNMEPEYLEEACERNLTF
jgi:hypothetical protein